MASAGFVKMKGTARTASEATMGKPVYLMNVSLDGYVETPDHSLDQNAIAPFVGATPTSGFINCRGSGSDCLQRPA
jgi:hypothetical protein